MTAERPTRAARRHVPPLLALIVALLVVGVVAKEIARHVLQAVPALLCLVAAGVNVRAVKWPAFAIYVFWIGIAVLIWLFLLHIAPIANGDYTIVEIAMTVVLAAAGAYGLFGGWRLSGGVSALGAVTLFGAAAAVQVLVMAVSLKAPWSSDAEFCAAFNVPVLCAATR